eukprot:g8457.t1
MDDSGAPQHQQAAAFLHGDAARVLADLFGVLLPVLIFLSPSPLFYRSFFGKDGTRCLPLGMPPLAFTAQFAQCWLWLVYAYLKEISFLVLANLCGIATGACYVALYPAAVRLNLEEGGGAGAPARTGISMAAPTCSPGDGAAASSLGRGQGKDVDTVGLGASTSPDGGRRAVDEEDVRTPLARNIRRTTGEDPEEDNPPPPSLQLLSRGDVETYLFQYKIQLCCAVVLGISTTVALVERPVLPALGVTDGRDWLGRTERDSGIGGYVAMSLGTVLLLHPVFTMWTAVKTRNPDLMGSVLMNGIYTACNVVLLLQGTLFNYNVALAVQSALGLLANLLALGVRQSLAMGDPGAREK